MIMSTNYSLLFYLKKPKNYVSGAKSTYMRITVAGEPKEVSTGRECDPARWNAKANRAKGKFNYVVVSARRSTSLLLILLN